MNVKDVVDLINKGGWQLVGGHQYKTLGHVLGALGAKVEAGVLVFSTELGSEIRLATGRMEVETRGQPQVDRFDIKLPHPVRQQRKKIDGGGWYDVEQMGTVAVFTNHTIETENQRLAEEKCRRERDEARAKHYCEVNEYFQQQLKLAGDGKIVGMKLEEDSVVITFENGHQLFFTSDGQGDGYCASLIVSDSTMPPQKENSYTDEPGIQTIFHGR